jgi:hypothetical protein
VITLESIVKELAKLPPHKLALAANYFRSLREDEGKGEERLAALKATAGCMNEDEADEFERFVREAGGHVG